MGNYYFLAGFLPPLEFSQKPEETFATLQSFLEQNLSKRDMEKVHTLRLFVDLCNIRPLLQEEDLDPKGNLKERELEEALLNEESLPVYVFDFFKQHEELSDKIRAFPGLMSQFFREQSLLQNGFLKEYFEFEREWRLMVLALRAKKLKRDFLKELQFEDVHDPFVMQILSQKDSESYDPPIEYKEIKEILHACGSDPWEQNKALCSYRFHKIQEIVHGSQFSMDSVLAYLAQLMIIEYWNELDEAKGRAILDIFKN